MKKKIKRVDLDILERIFITMYDLGNAKRTIISRNANMSYDKCVKYLEYLESSGFAKQEKDENGYVLFSLTSNGIDMVKKKLVIKSEQDNQINKIVISSILD